MLCRVWKGLPWQSKQGCLQQPHPRRLTAGPFQPRSPLDPALLTPVHCRGPASHAHVHAHPTSCHHTRPSSGPCQPHYVWTPVSPHLQALVGPLPATTPAPPSSHPVTLPTSLTAGPILYEPLPTSPRPARLARPFAYSLSPLAAFTASVNICLPLGPCSIKPTA